MAWENLDEERLKQIIRQVSGKTPRSTDKLVRPSKLVCKGEKWYYVPSKREHRRFICGIKVYVVDYELDERDRVLVYDGNCLFAVPIEELEELGFN
jgi:hypothetical protein